MAIGLLKRRCSFWFSVLALSLASCLSIAPRSVAAQDEKKPKALPPLVVINAAGVDRLLGDVNFMFKTIGRDDLSDFINGFLKNYGDLGGLDRKKSMGVMLYFKPGLTPGVEPVGYVPVTDIGDLTKTLQLDLVGATVKKVPGDDGRYELEGTPQPIFVQMQGGYAYVANSEAAFDRELPDPGPLTQSLSQRYDLAASLNIEGIPELMRTIFLDFLRAQTEAQLQQRDNEPEAAYRARKASGMNNLKNIEAVVKEGQSITIGVDASQETRAIVVELEMKARPSSGFAEQLKKFPGKPSVFANAYSEQIPLAATGSWNLTKDDKEMFAELVKALDAGLKKGMMDDNLDPTPVGSIIKSLESTVSSGSVDFFVQFVGEPPGKFSLVGGIKIDRAGEFASGLQGILQQLSKLPQIAELELNAESHNGVALHRVLGKGEGGRGERQLYGGMPAFYVGAGRGAVWFGLGKEGTADQLKKAMTLVETVPETPIARDKIAPFQMVMNLSSWVGLTGQGEENGRPNLMVPGDEAEAARQAARRAAWDAERKARRAAARDAFKPENDRLLITARPVKDGFRLKLQFDEGFIRYMGLRISSQLDRSQL